MTESKVYTIPLRREFQKVSYKNKTNKAVKAVKEFVLKHSKADKVVLGEELNEKMWAQGITNPPHKVQVEITKETVTKDNKDVVEAFVNLVGHKRTVIEQSRKGIIQGSDAPGGIQGKLKEAVDTLKGDKEEKIESSKEEAKKEAKPKADSKPAPKVKTTEKAAEPKSSEAKKAPETKTESKKE